MVVGPGTTQHSKWLLEDTNEQAAHRRDKSVHSSFSSATQNIMHYITHELKENEHQPAGQPKKSPAKNPNATYLQFPLPEASNSIGDPHLNPGVYLKLEQPQDLLQTPNLD